MARNPAQIRRQDSFLIGRRPMRFTFPTLSPSEIAGQWSKLFFDRQQSEQFHFEAFPAAGLGLFVEHNLFAIDLGVPADVATLVQL
jgi:hypothetical protein